MKFNTAHCKNCSHPSNIVMRAKTNTRVFRALLRKSVSRLFSRVCLGNRREKGDSMSHDGYLFFISRYALHSRFRLGFCVLTNMAFVAQRAVKTYFSVYRKIHVILYRVKNDKKKLNFCFFRPYNQFVKTWISEKKNTMKIPLNFHLHVLKRINENLRIRAHHQSNSFIFLFLL